MNIKSTVFILFSILSLPFPSEAFFQTSYDLVVVGGGVGGCAAAIQAASSGLSVAVLEESDYLGGQIAGAAVSTMDDLGRTRHGLYAEFIEYVRSHYSELGTATNICLWGGDTIATEPQVARDFFMGLLSEAGADIYLLTRVKNAILDGNRVVGAEAERKIEELDEIIVISADVFIDATECGDFLPLAGAAYRAGASLSDNIDLQMNVQDITYVAVVKKYPGGLREDLRMPGPPPLYELYAPKFRKTVTVSGDRWPGTYPFDIPSHNAYRALPDPENLENRARIVGDDPKTWQFITKTCINWANDFPGNGGGSPGLPVAYIEDPEYRKKAGREAMNKTLAFIWYMQSELGMTDWSVDDSPGYGGWFSNGWESADDPLLPAPFAPILRRFPPFPYVREGRRIVGIETLAQSDISGAAGAPRRFAHGLALGEYPVDVHGSHLDRYMEHEFNESSETFPRTWTSGRGVFQIPFGVFIPKSVDGLIAAEKNISVSRMAGGAIRVQPAVFHTGQAAGAIAAESVRSGRPPRDADVLLVQRALMDSGCWIAPEECQDAMEGSPYWSPVQWAILYEALPKISRLSFGVNLPIKTNQLRGMIMTAFGIPVPDTLELGDGMYLSKRQFLDYLEKLGKSGEKIRAAHQSETDPGLSLTRGDAARAIYDALTLF